MDSPHQCKHRLSTVVVRVLTCQVFAGSLLLAQTQPQERPQFKVGSTEVVVDVIVTDRKGHPVRQLTANDFRVFEDDVEQKITSFTPLPDSAVESTPNTASATVQTADTTVPPERLPHYITVVMDLPDNQQANIKRSCDAVLRYLEKTRTADTMVAIYYIAGGLRLALPFTNDFRQAERSINQLSRGVAGKFNRADRIAIQEQINELQSKANPETLYGGIGGLSPAVSQSSRSAPGEPFAEAYRREIATLRTYLNFQNTYQAMSLLVALRALATSYFDLPGRKNVVLFSEGFRYAEDARGQLDAVMAAANAANVSFYVIDPAGLGTGMTLSAHGTATEATQIVEIANEGPGQRGGESKFDRIRNVGAETDVHEQLAELADATGGILTKNTNDLGPAFAKILDDSRNFYTLAYQPVNKNADGTFRKIRVSLDKEGYLLRHRQGYWAVPRSEGVAMTPSQAHLYTSVASGSLKSVFAPAVQANLALAADGQYYVPMSVLLPASALPGEKDVAAGSTALMLVAFARDQQGRIVSTYEHRWDLQRSRKDLGNSTITLQAQLPVARPQPLHLQTIVQLPSGAFAVGESEIAYNAAGGPPAMTGLFLTDQVEQTKCEDRSEALCVLNVRLRQPASLEFSRSSRLVAYLVVTGMLPDAQTKQPRIGTAFVLKNGDKVVATVRPEAVQALPGPLPDSVTLIAEMGFQSLPAGTYLLEVKARDIVRNTATTGSTSFQLK